MKHIKIDEIVNGFVVELFDDDGPSNLDKTIFCKDWEEVTKTVMEWRENEDNSIEDEAKS
jgi:hypothetical protein